MAGRVGPNCSLCPCRSPLIHTRQSFAANVSPMMTNVLSGETATPLAKRRLRSSTVVLPVA
eukprot:3896174-Rhodomonas_salina.1